MSYTAIRAGVVRQFQLFLALDGSVGHLFSVYAGSPFYWTPVVI